MEDDEVIDAVLQAADPFASTPEIAEQESVTYTRRGLHDRLVSLAEGGKLARKEVGNTTVWWVPGEGAQPVTAGDVYTDGGVAERVDRLEATIQRLDGSTEDLEHIVEELRDETRQTRETVGAIDRAVRSPQLPALALIVGFLLAAVESVMGAVPGWAETVGGFLLVFGLVGLVYTVLLSRTGTGE